MAYISKRTGSKGTTYQIRYPSKATESGFAYKTFTTLKQARAFTQRIGALPEPIPKSAKLAKSVSQAVDDWLNICEKIGRDGREKVEPQTLVEYKRWPAAWQGPWLIYDARAGSFFGSNAPVVCSCSPRRLIFFIKQPSMPAGKCHNHQRRIRFSNFGT